ncbi:MipA/OmpV family protein [Rhizobium sp. RAF56]|uniref:MipA/OmpV family protein n=1 Tax=Rhizobium sp. RAF56 TaxID=3233062 RepID=UPI003F9C2D42
MIEADRTAPLRQRQNGSPEGRIHDLAHQPRRRVNAGAKSADGGKFRSRRRWSAAFLLAAIAFAGLAPSSLAQEATKPGTDRWIVTVGGATEYGPTYEGSKHYSFSGLPSFDFRRLGDQQEFGAPDDNIDYSLLDFGGLEIGPVVGLRGGRSTSDDWRLQGLKGVQWNIDAGGFAQYWASADQLRVRAEARQALWGGDGLVVDVGTDWFQPLTDDVVLSAGPRLSFGNAPYMRNNFGVSKSEAAASRGLKAFDAQGGVKSVGFTVGVAIAVSPQWSIDIYNRYDRLVGSASSSPVVTDIGSKNQNIIGLSLNRSFEIGR